MTAQDARPTHTSQPAQESWRDLPAGFADYLDLEARLSAPLKEATLSRAARAVDAPPLHIVDLGSGTGADAVVLARRFPKARVHALDVSTELLDRVAPAAVAAGVADRVEGQRVDLDGDWSAGISVPVDLVWASLTLHHVNDPTEVVRRVFEALRPGGVFVLTELTGDAQFTPADLGTGRHGLSERIMSAPSTHGAGVHTGWSGLLAEVGFDPAERRDHNFTARADTPDGAQYLERQLRSHRNRLGYDLSGNDLASLDAAIGTLHAGASELSFASGRAVWVAVRPYANTPDSTTQLKAEHSSTIRPQVSAASPPRASFDAEVAVIGGGSAGLAAAIALARSRRNVVVIDAGQPRNAPADGAHNVLGNEGISPLELLARGRTEAESYGARIVPGQATGLSGEVDDFTVEVGDGAKHVRARRIILATGLVDDLPDVPGVADGWGHTVLHCPFCHGWEVRDQRIAILTRDEIAVHHAMLFRQLSNQVTMFLHDGPDPTQEQEEQLQALNVPAVRPRVKRLVMDGTHVRGVETADGQTVDVDAVVIAPRFNARTDLFESLGGAGEETPFGRQIPADPRGKTPVAGVWAAGNASQPMAMLVGSAASGVTTGTAVHGDLCFADLNKTVQTRHPRIP